MTKLEIIEETVAYYSEDPSRRAVDQETGNCSYEDAKGRRCAVGRCLKEKYIPEARNINGTVAVLVDILDNTDIFRPKYQRHELRFWIILQGLHDLESNWTSTGLSSKGEERVKQLKELYANN